MSSRACDSAVGDASHAPPSASSAGGVLGDARAEVIVVFVRVSRARASADAAGGDPSGANAEGKGRAWGEVVQALAGAARGTQADSFALGAVVVCGSGAWASAGAAGESPSSAITEVVVQCASRAWASAGAAGENPSSANAEVSGRPWAWAVRALAGASRFSRHSSLALGVAVN